MMHELTEAEKKERDARVSHLFESVWIHDNVAAILMKTDPFGLNEDVAQAKAVKIIEWIESVARVTVPATRPRNTREARDKLTGKNTA